MSGQTGLRRLRSIFRPGLFKNKVAVVTGGATGIGKAITEELLYLGCSVTIASRNEENLRSAVNDLRSGLTDQDGQPRISFIPCNIRSEEQVKKLVSLSLESHGRLDFLVNNGGGQFLSKADGISLKGWNAVVETNLTGSFLLCREAYSQWMKDHGGSIVNITMENTRGFPLASHSGAARAGVENLTRSLAVEWAESGVRVNAVAPGAIYSATAAKNYERRIFDEAPARMAAKRAGTPQEVSSAVCFLLSAGASYVSGTTLFVDAATRLHPGHLFDVPAHDRWPKHDSCIDYNAEELS
ncbi:peroxisomal trans-2-enoyl-CoA reductase-like [Ixodes scapularis]|uniref:peroxisomal trans-2-enoyl-CoA reductase-like n=1 Tax=Ixodes scapularis TaxID=6945 RepID=UPI001A9DA200|nr:peroxisomal trans-2-enoyl-CoA reductase-like [Ixodes scapularis]